MFEWCMYINNNKIPISIWWQLLLVLVIVIMVVVVVVELLLLFLLQGNDLLNGKVNSSFMYTF